MAAIQEMLFAFDLLGTVAFAISGAAVAIRGKLDLIGIMILAFATGNGGGTIRDLILGAPVFWTENEWFILLVVAPAIVLFILLLCKNKKKESLLWGRLLVVADTLGLIAFTISGASKALVYEQPLTVAVMMGVLTAVGGGVLRDILAGKVPSIFGGELYFSSALVGAFLYVGLQEVSWQLAVGLATIAIVFLRVMTVKFGWELPHFRN